MTTKEVAAYLRIKERRVYELVRQRAIPCARVTGKWLFPKTLVDLWLADRVEGERPAKAPPPVIAGSHVFALEALAFARMVSAFARSWDPRIRASAFALTRSASTSTRRVVNSDWTIWARAAAIRR